MPFEYNFGGEKGTPEATFNGERANQWTDAQIPLSGTTIYLSGNSPQIAQLTEFGALHMLVSQNSCHIVSSTSPTFSASTVDQYLGADIPYFHIPRSGSTEYVSVYNNDGTQVQAWISPAEKIQ